MELKRIAVVTLGALALVLSAILLRSRATPPSNSPVPSSNPFAKEVSVRPSARIASEHVPAPARAESPSSESIIEVPASPPDTAVDDAIESGLPRPIFDEKTALEDERPSDERLDEAEDRLGEAIEAPLRARLGEIFRKRNDEAAAAIGYFRLGELSEDEAMAAIVRARQAYRREAMAALSRKDGDFEGILGAKKAP